MKVRFRLLSLRVLIVLDKHGLKRFQYCYIVYFLYKIRQSINYFTTF